MYVVFGKTKSTNVYFKTATHGHEHLQLLQFLQYIYMKFQQPVRFINLNI